MKNVYTTIESEGNGYKVTLLQYGSDTVLDTGWAPLYEQAIALSAAMLKSVIA